MIVFLDVSPVKFVGKAAVEGRATGKTAASPAPRQFFFSSLEIRS